MSTTISNPTFSTVKKQSLVPTGVTPANATDSNGYKWSVSGESANGAQFEFTVVGPGRATSGTCSNNRLTCTMTAGAAGTTSYVQVTAAYTAPQNAANWTLQASSSGSNPLQFAKGGGGGDGRKTTVKASY